MIYEVSITASIIIVADFGSLLILCEPEITVHQLALELGSLRIEDHLFAILVRLQVLTLRRRVVGRALGELDLHVGDGQVLSILASLLLGVTLLLADQILVVAETA